MGLDTEKIKEDFPILKRRMNGKRLVYLDSASTSQKPIQVINKVNEVYKEYNSNIHRGIYKISEKATEEYIGSKEKASRFVNSDSYREIVYVRNATEAINLVALTWGEDSIKKNDHILISSMEHHSNIVPWQLLAKRKGAVLDYIGLTKDFLIDMDDYGRKLEGKPKIVAITHASNVLGTINDVEKIARMAHAEGAHVLVDGAQSAPHMRVDVKRMGCDFFALSSHKMLGPSGIGVLYAKEGILEDMRPLLGGGDMIKSVSFKESAWNELPWKFEAGTQNIEGAIGFGAAIDYLDMIGMDSVRKHENGLASYALKRLDEIEGLRVYGPSDTEKKGGIASFSIDGIHPHDVAQVLDSEGIAIRSGHHCAMPLVKEIIGEPSLSRMSFYVYNSKADIDAAIEALGKAKKMFGKGRSG
jgi:cysteine desulfurase/selenocysteine lyase